MKKICIFSIFSIFLLTGCAIQKNGDDLSGFIFKMNEKNENYNLSAEGFLYSEEENNFYKFFVVDEKEILFSFNTDTNGRLIEMNIVLENDFYNYDNTLTFLTDSIFSFINNDICTNEIIESIDFYNAVKTTSKETLKTKNGNIEFLLDVTEIGTVITIYKDI